MARYIQQDGQLINVSGGPRLPGYTHAVIHHGDDPNISRPDELDVVTWVGNVEPVNMANGDFWESLGSSEETLEYYVLRDGTRGFTAPIAGVEPLNPEHLTTKSFVDNSIDQAISYVDSGLPSFGDDYLGGSITISDTDYTTNIAQGPATTINVPDSGNVLVLISARLRLDSGSFIQTIWGCTGGANDITFSADSRAALRSSIVGEDLWFSSHGIGTGLNPGPTEFRILYRANGSGIASTRRITVIPLP